MKRYVVWLYQTARGDNVVANKLQSIQRSERQSWTAIRTGIEMLEENGIDTGLNKFKRLRYVEGGSIWELRAQGRPAYRVLFAPLPGEDAFVILDVVRKDDFSHDSQHYINRALSFYDHWLTYVHKQ